MKRVLKSHPGILRYEVETRLEPHAVWLEEEGLTKAGIGKILSKLPQARLEECDSVHLACVFIRGELCWRKSRVVRHSPIFL